MNIEKQISGLSQLSIFIADFLNTNPENYSESQNDFQAVLRKSEIDNPWFTLESQKFALKQWADLLTENSLSAWIAHYSIAKTPKNVGLILAGNIPLVGFHDVLAVLLSGHHASIKLSSKDKVMLPYLLEKWQAFSGEILNYELVEKLQNYDAIIATGSNNTARYLEYYFKDTLNIIRKNRTSVAVLTGEESSEELKLLAEDIFRYYGLGCRNVTRLFLPQGFVLDRLFESFTDFSEIINHHKYANNYEYNRAVYLLNQQIFWDNNFVILKEDENLFSPLSVLNFTYYTDLAEVKTYLSEHAESIQVVVADKKLGLDGVSFGDAQKPDLLTYADHIDTMKFLEVL